MKTQQSSPFGLPRRERRASITALLVGAVLAGPLAASPVLAQTKPPTPPATSTATVRTPLRMPMRTPSRAVSRNPSLNPVCAELASMPSTLVHAPEGRALLKFKRDLEGAAAVLESRGETPERIEVRRMAEVNRNVDSLMQFVVQGMKTADGKELSIVTVRGRDGARSAGHLEPLRQMDPQQREQLTATIRSLEPQIARVTYEIAARGAVRIPMPTGWMGVTFSQATLDVPSPSGLLTHYCEYPVIEVVHSNSPAARAGLLAGDTVVAFNRKDLRAAAVNMTALLVPNRTLQVDYKRDGRAGQASLRITERPDNQTTTFFRRTCAPGIQCDGPMISLTIDSLRPSRTPVAAGGPPSSQGTRVFVRTAPTPSGGSMSPSMAPSMSAMTPTARAAAVASATSSANVGIAMLAGAQFAEIDDGFAAEMGVERGVLALLVPPNSAAWRSGLRSGEMILAVNGVPLREVRPLRRAFEAQGAREVRLTVTRRDTPARIVTIRW
ncbi:MAG: PDZ domain-containing protein [Gemmatimonadota bacterium]